MISITTKFLGPTNHHGSRVSAIVSDYGSDLEVNCRTTGDKRPGRVILPWNSSLNVEDNHRQAARALAHNLGWDGERVGGDAKGSEGYTFIRNLDHAPRFTVG